MQHVTKRRSALAVAVILLVSLFGPTTAPAHASAQVAAGGCVLTVTATFNPPLTTALRDTSVGLSGSGPCLVNATVTSGTLVAGMGSNVPMSCAGGTATGLANLTFASPDVPNFPGNFAAFALEGVAGELVLERDIAVFLGAGAMAPLAVTPGVCNTSSITYLLPIAFEDPVIETEA